MINVFKNFGTAGNIHEGNSNVDQSAIGDFLNLDREAQNNKITKIKDIEDNYNDLVTSFDSMNFRFDNLPQNEDLVRLKRNHGISDDIFDDITVQDIEKGAVTERFKSGLSGIEKDPLFKNLVVEQAEADLFKSKVRELAAKDKVLGARAMKAFNDRYVNLKERSLFLGGFPISIDEFMPIDLNKEVDAELGRVLQRQITQQIDDKSAPGQVLIHDVSGVPGDRNVHLQLADNLLKARMDRDPQFQHNLEALLAFNSADGDFEDSDVYNDYLDEVVTKATKSKITKTTVRKGSSESSLSAGDKEIVKKRKLLKETNPLIDWDDVSDAVVDQWGRKWGEVNNTVKANRDDDGNVTGYYMKVGKEKVNLPLLGKKSELAGDETNTALGITQKFGNIKYSFKGKSLTDNNFEDAAEVSPRGRITGVSANKVRVGFPSDRYKINTVDGVDYFETTSPDLAVKFGFESEPPDKKSVNWLPKDWVYRYPVLSGDITEASALPEPETPDLDTTKSNVSATSDDVAELGGLIDVGFFKDHFPKVYADFKGSFDDGSALGVERLSKIVKDIGEDKFYEEVQKYSANKSKNDLLSLIGKPVIKEKEETVVKEAVTPTSSVPKKFSKVDYTKTDYKLDQIKKIKHFEDLDLVHLSGTKLGYDKDQVTFPVVTKDVSKYLDLIAKDFPDSKVTGGARDPGLNGDANKGKGDAGVKKSAHLKAKALDFNKDAKIGDLIGKNKAELKKYGINKIMKHGKPLHIHVEFI